MDELKGTVKPTIGHEALIGFLLCNPTATNAALGRHFGYTKEYISALVNNDAFKRRFEEKQKEVWGEVKVIAVSVHNRLEAVAHESLERLLKKLEVHDDPNFLLETSEMACKALGYAPSKGPAVGPAMQQNNFYIDRNVLGEARGQILNAQRIETAPRDEAFRSSEGA